MREQIEREGRQGEQGETRMGPHRKWRKVMEIFIHLVNYVRTRERAALLKRSSSKAVKHCLDAPLL